MNLDPDFSEPPKRVRGRPKGDERELAEKHRARMRDRRAEIQRTSSDIGSIPPVVDPERRFYTERSFLAYIQTYETAKFGKPFAEAHLRVIEAVEHAVLYSGLFAMALPRGSGKTTISRAAARWALLHGHRRFVIFIGATDTDASASKDTILSEFENNELLREDFPEVCIPFAALEGSVAKCKGQRCEGERTMIVIDNVHKEIRLPWIAGSKSAGSILRWAGITGRIRGDNRDLPDGTSVRPDFVVIDDPQTEESAKSAMQNRDRLGIVRGAVLGLAGPGKQIAGVMPCTVIKPGDMADSVLDMERAPEWSGSRVGFFSKLPKNLDRWDAYMDLVRSRLREVKLADGKPAEAYESGRAFVEAHYDELHDGAEVYWPERKDDHELSAVHHAFNTILRIGWEAWHAEYQNQPVDPTKVERQIQIEDFEDKPAGYRKEEAPTYVNTIASFVDVQSECLFWMTCGFSEDFRCAIVDYGIWPDQGTLFVDLDNLRYPMSTLLGIGAEAEDARVLAALKRLLPELADAQVRTEADARLNVSQVLVDRGAWTDVVDQAVRELRLPNLMGMKGLPVMAGDKPMIERNKHAGDKRGENWFVTKSAKDQFTRYMQPDVNYWKSFVRDRIFTPAGNVGDLRLPGKSAREHDALIDHLTCEYAIRTTKKNQTRDEWRKRPGRERNDFFDCLVGCYIGASMHGCKLVDRGPSKEAKRRTPEKTLSLSEIQRMRRQ